MVSQELLLNVGAVRATVDLLYAFMLSAWLIEDHYKDLPVEPLIAYGIGCVISGSLLLIRKHAINRLAFWTFAIVLDTALLVLTLVCMPYPMFYIFCACKIALGISGWILALVKRTREIGQDLFKDVDIDFVV